MISDNEYLSEMTKIIKDEKYWPLPNFFFALHQVLYFLFFCESSFFIFLITWYNSKINISKTYKFHIRYRDVHRGWTCAATAPRRQIKNVNRAATVIQKCEPRRWLWKSLDFQVYERFILKLWPLNDEIHQVLQCSLL